MQSYRVRIILPCALVALVAACSINSPGTGDDGTAKAGQSPQFTGVALPPGYSLDGDRSLALGAGERWIGRIVFTTGMSSNDAFDFYRREMPRLGWSEGAVVRAETSMLTFTSTTTERVAVVQIAGRTLSGSRVEMVVSPASGGADGMVPATAAAPMARATPRNGGVTTQPLQ